MSKKIITVLLTVLLVLSLVPLTALAGAEESYAVWIDGKQITESNKGDVLEDKSVSFDPQTNTLTLNNAVFGKAGTATGFENVCAVKSRLDTLTVNLIGTNQIGKEATSESAMEDFSIDLAFSCDGNLVFTGGGALTVYDYRTGIFAKNVTFDKNFTGKLTVRDCGGPEPQPPCCVIYTMGVFDEASGDYKSDGTITVLGGTLDLESFQSEVFAAHGNITIENAAVTAVASYGVLESVCGNITVKNSTLTAVGDTALCANSGNITVENTNLKASADGCEGITAQNITLKDCAQVAVLGSDEALYARETASIINCADVKLEANWLNTISADDIIIENSTVDATANNGYSGFVALADEGSAGTGTVKIKNSKVNIKAEGNAIRSAALEVTGAKSEVYAVGDTDKDGNGFGALIEGDETKVTVKDGTFKLTGGKAALKFEAESTENPFKGILQNAAFTGNTAFDTFSPLKAVSYKSEDGQLQNSFWEYAYIGDELAKSLAVIHTHAPKKVNGVEPTTEAAGFKSYFECGCGKYFEDAEGKTEIPDIEKWKTVGGGYLPKLAKPEAPTEKIPDTGDTGSSALCLVLMCAAALLLTAKKKNA